MGHLQPSYTKNYLKIYFWQGFSLLLNLVSMFVVVPLISSDKELYGIYMICTSLSIFLTYADLGFLGAGQKFAAESFARNDLTEERKTVGFTAFILLLFLLLLSSVFLYLSFYPQLIIKNLGDSLNGGVASSLLFILACFTPITMLQRIVQLIFDIRLQNYVHQRINIIGNIVKISSVFYFFSENRYDIVGYFLFSQCVNLVVIILNIYLAERKFNYDFLKLFSVIKFNKIIFRKTLPLALSMFFAVISWILYYELDSLGISFLFGAESVAIYGIGLTVLTLIRSVLGVLFSPFTARFNHFYGLGNEQGLKEILEKIITLYAPIVIIPLVSLFVMADLIVISWVGVAYEKSIPIFKLLVLCNILAFISYPIGIFLTVKQWLNKMYIINILMPVIFWVGILLTKEFLYELSFAVFKFVAFMIVGIIYLKIAIEYIGYDFLWRLKKYIFAFVPIFLILIYSHYLLTENLNLEKSGLNLFIIGLMLSLIFIVSFVYLFCVVSDFQNKIKTILGVLRK